MRLLLVSDNHGNSHILDELAAKYDGEVDAFVHCGDSELDSQQLIWEIMDSVRGNMDFDSGYKDMRVNREAAYPYLTVHGHQQHVNHTLSYLAELAEEEKVEFVFYGHTHILKFDQINGVWFINPGSIQSPRGELRERTYCILEVDDKRLSISVYNDSHEPLTDLNVDILKGDIIND